VNIAAKSQAIFPPSFFGVTHKNGHQKGENDGAERALQRINVTVAALTFIFSPLIWLQSPSKPSTNFGSKKKP